MIDIVLDAGTTWSKIIERKGSNKINPKFLIKEENGLKYYIIPSSELKSTNIIFDKATGHMSLNLIKDKKDYENEIIALTQGFRKKISEDSLILDMGSRDSKWVLFKNSRFKDLDWNSSCSSSTGATIEMLLKFYNLKPQNIEFNKEKYIITCGIFGLERIMDDIAKGEKSEVAIAKFIHGIAYNAWVFAKKPKKLYLSGGFCENNCFLTSINQYCEAIPLGRFLLCEGLID